MTAPHNAEGAPVREEPRYSEPKEVFGVEVLPNRIELIDYIVIGSGQLLIGDPSFLKAWKANDYVSKPTLGGIGITREGIVRKKPEPTQEYSFDGACTASYSDRGCGGLSIVGEQKAQTALAVVARSDPGLLAVYAERSRETGEIVAMHIYLDPAPVYDVEVKDDNPDLQEFEDPKDWLNE